MADRIKIPGTTLTGFQDMARAFNKTARESKTMFRSTMREIAEPVRAGAERLAVQEISHIGPLWPQMRTGLTTRSLYVAPKQRGRFARKNPRRYARPKFGDELMDKAMAPSLAAHEPLIADRAGNALDKLLDRWEAF